jgi:hypothetical protein
MVGIFPKRWVFPIRRFFKKGIFPGLLLAISMVAHAGVIAFGLSTAPFVENMQNIQICFLDKYDLNLAAINNDLRNYNNPNPPGLAAEDLAKFKAISDSLLCQYQAQKLGIKKLPAIIFDAKDVVYGELNINQAIRDYQFFEERRNG